MLVPCECGKKLRVMDKMAGKRIKCPACGIALMVPAAEAKEEVVEEPSVEEPSEEEEPEPEPEPAPRKRKKKRSKKTPSPGLLAAVAGVAVVGLALFGVALFLMLRTNEKKPATAQGPGPTPGNPSAVGQGAGQPSSPRPDASPPGPGGAERWRYVCTNVAFHPRSSVFAAVAFMGENGNAEPQIVLWDRSAHKKVGKIALLHGMPQAVAIAPDGASVAVVNDVNNHVDLWELPSGRLVQTFSFAGDNVTVMPTVLAFSPDSTHLIVIAKQKCVAVKIATRTVIPIIDDLGDLSTTLAYSPEQDLLLVSRVAIGDVPPISGYRLFAAPNARKVPVPLRDSASAMSFTGDGRTLAVSSFSVNFAPGGGTSFVGKVELFDTATWKSRGVLGPARQSADYYKNIVLTPDGKRLAGKGPKPDSFLDVWDVAANTVKTMGFSGFDTVQFTPNGRHLMVCFGESWAQYRDVQTGAEIAP